MKYILLFVITLVGSQILSAQTKTPIVNYGSEWRYLDNGSNPGTSWSGLSFNDATWKTGLAELGYGDGDEATIVSFGTNTRKKYLTTYFRRNFTITDTLSFGKYELSLKRDDGAIVFVNGIEVFRTNMPSGAVNFNGRASSEPADDGKTAVLADLATSAFRNGNNVIAVEVHQSSPSGEDISFDLQLIASERVNTPPSVNAGADKSFSLPLDSVQLIAAGTDSEFNIISYAWTKTSGPDATIATPAAAATMVKGLSAGVYVFRVKVTDLLGLSAEDDVQVTVTEEMNNPPVVDAGLDTTITAPADSVTLFASASDQDGSIVSYNWTKVSGGSATIFTGDSSATGINGLVAGSYIFRVTVTDDKGAVAFDEVSVTVSAALNIDPTVNAGNDTTITLPADSVRVNALGFDTDGEIVFYQWTKKNGASAIINAPTSPSSLINGLQEGTYVFQIIVTDDRGGTAADELTVTVLPVPNIPPSVTASADTVIVLPADSVTLRAFAADSDGTVVSYQWTKVSGSGGIIYTPDSPTTGISALTEGAYLFSIKVKDNFVDSASAEVSVRVELPPNVLPVVNAGKDTTIVLPVNQVNLEATASDADGNIVSYQWKKISGPDAVITSPGMASTSVTSLTNGNYVFVVTVTDNRNGSSTDTVAVSVLLPNVLPSVELGAEKYVFLPNAISLTAVATDPDGQIMSYGWSKTSGAGAVISTPSAATTNITGLAVGNYTFRVRVMDNRGDSAVDEVGVTVLDGKTTSPYQLPVAQSMLINLNGVKGKDAWRIFDNNLSTKIDANSVDESKLALPYSSYVILDSVYDLNQVSYFVQNSDQTNGPTLRFLNENRQYVGDSLQLSTKGKYLTWTSFNKAYPGIRFIEVTAYTRGQLGDGVMEVRVTAWGKNPAASIYPVTAIGTVNDLGVYAHGVNILGDRINTRTESGDSILPKVAKAARFYWEGTTFDIYPQTYINALEAGPVNLGRYGFNHSGNLLDRFKQWDIRAMMTKTGGSIKYLGSDTASWNNTWLGGTHAQLKKYIEPGANPELAASWKGLAEQYHKLIALYGSNAAATVPPASILNGNTTLGQNNMEIFEWDNEPNRTWQLEYYHSPKAYYQAIKAVYNRGKQADPNARIFAGALPGIDTVYWKALYFVHYLENGLAPFPADGFNFNNYLNNDRLGQLGQSGRYGISPEQFDLRATLTSLKGFFDKHFPNKTVQWTEFGYATDDVSDYDVDPIRTKTDKMVQADWTLRVKALAQTVRFLPRLYYYAYFEDFTAPFNSMAMVRDTFNTQGVYMYSKVQPVAYALAQEIYAEKNYPFFSTVVTNGDSTGVWVTRKDNPADATKRLYKLWRGSANGDTTRYVFNVTNMVNAKIYTQRYDSFVPDSVTRTVTGDTLQLNVTEGMVWVEATIRTKKPPRQVAITALAEEGIDKFNVYPVPVRRGEILTINLGSGKARELLIYNASGQKIKHLKASGLSYIGTSEFAPGTYFIYDLSAPGKTRRFVVTGQ
jgi:PKD domain